MRKLPLITEQALVETRSQQTETHESFKRQLDRDGIETTCRKTCSHCCRHPIYISVLEGALLYQWLWKEGLWTRDLRKQLQEHSKLVAGLPAETWILSEISCPLLKDDLCTAYKARPLVCRTTYSEGLPELCEPRQFSSQTPLIPRLSYLAAFQLTERQQYRTHGVSYRTVPLSMAILLGAKLATGEQDLGGISEAMYQHYLEAL